MRFLSFVLLLGLACAKAPDSKARLSGTVPVCDPRTMTIEDGPVPSQVVGGAGDAVATGRMVLRVIDSCHMLELPLLRTGGSPAQEPGPAEGSFQRSYGIVRINLQSGISEIGQTDSTFSDPAVAAAYVVHGLTGAYFLDVHVAGPVKASSRPSLLSDRVGVVLASGGGAVPTPAPRARNVVVLEPRQGTAAYPLKVRGYARTFEANVQAWITKAGTTERDAMTHTTAADWSTTWGEFELTIPSGPSGDVDLFVGEESAQDGTPIGVTIRLRMP